MAYTSGVRRLRLGDYATAGIFFASEFLTAVSLVTFPAPPNPRCDFRVVSGAAALFEQAAKKKEVSAC